MQTLAIAIGSLVLYFVAYHTYGRWLARKIFKLDDANTAPSVAMEDGTDYVPTAKSVVFGHHFTSIAGLGPILGPALAVIWGWVPALLWVLFGSILIGAVHDFGSVVISMRHRGQTIGDIAGKVLHPRARILFLSILFLALTLVLAVFGVAIAKVFKAFPMAIFPSLVQIPLAMGIGAFIHRRGKNLLPASLAVLTLMYLSVWFGDVGLLHTFNATLAALPTIVWVVFLLLYSYAASVLPVWLLLQPRDYINSLQLLSTLGLIVIGLVATPFLGHSLEIIAPAIDSGKASTLPLMFPFLFITIACGAVSGFHCLVSSGTTSKQIRCESDAQFVGYGSMLTEGFLAVIVILACVAGLGLGENPDIWNERYGTWLSAEKGALGSFIIGASNFVQSLGISAAAATAIIAVFVASFAATTLDTSCRLQRYVVEELAGTLFRHREVLAPHTGIKITANPLTWLSNRHGATLFGIGIAALVSAIPRPGEVITLENAGTGGFILWPLFGAMNQLLGGLAFIVILFWLRRKKLPIFFALIPALVMLVMPAWALAYQLFFAALGSDQSWLATKSWALAFFAITTLAIELWMITEAILAWPKVMALETESR